MHCNDACALLLAWGRVPDATQCGLTEVLLRLSCQFGAALVQQSGHQQFFGSRARVCCSQGPLAGCLRCEGMEAPVPLGRGCRSQCNLGEALQKFVRIQVHTAAVMLAFAMRWHVAALAAELGAHSGRGLDAGTRRDAALLSWPLQGRRGAAAGCVCLHQSRTSEQSQALPLSS